MTDDEEADAKPGDKLGCYYVVDKEREEAFWLHPVPASFFCDGAELKIISREHMGTTVTFKMQGDIAPTIFLLLGYGARMGYW